MAVWIIACFLALHWRFSLSVPTADTKTMADTSLTDRLSHLERLVHHLDTAVHRLERGTGDSAKPFGHRGAGLEVVVRQDFDVRRSNEEEREKGQCADLRAEWREAKRAWEIEKQALTKLLKETLQKQTPSYDNGTAADVAHTSHDTEPAFDDENTQVTDINLRLTEVIRLVQNLKSSNAQIYEAQSSLNSDIQSLREAKMQQDQAIQEAGSSVYVRWGNSRCPNSTSLVYSGVVGGSLYTDKGSATNYLCLTLEPIMSDRTVTGATARLVGAEYYSLADGHIHNEDPVCAVCRSTRPAVIMVPGTNRCMASWTMEYSGFLMSGHYGDAGNFEYVCVDERFEGRMGGHPHLWGALFEFTVAQCGSLPCGPYVDKKVVTCVVCSK